MSLIGDYQSRVQQRLHDRFEREAQTSDAGVVCAAWIGALISEAVYLAAIVSEKEEDLDAIGKVIDELRDVFGRHFPALPASRATTGTIRSVFHRESKA